MGVMVCIMVYDTIMVYREMFACSETTRQDVLSCCFYIIVCAAYGGEQSGHSDDAYKSKLVHPQVSFFISLDTH